MLAPGPPPVPLSYVPPFARSCARSGDTDWAPGGWRRGVERTRGRAGTARPKRPQGQLCLVGSQGRRPWRRAGTELSSGRRPRRGLWGSRGKHSLAESWEEPRPEPSGREGSGECEADGSPKPEDLVQIRGADRAPARSGWLREDPLGRAPIRRWPQGRAVMVGALARARSRAPTRRRAAAAVPGAPRQGAARRGASGRRGC